MKQKWVAFLITGLFIVPAYAAENGRVTVLDPPEGTRIQRVEDIDFVPLKMGDSVQEGDKVQTGLNSKVEITFTDGSKISLKPNTIITLKRLRTDAATGARKTQLRLFLGTMKSDVEHLKNMNSVFEIHTPTAVAGVRGTNFTTDVDQDRNTHLYVENGAVYLESTMTGEGTLVGSSQSAEVSSNGVLTQAKILSGNTGSSSGNTSGGNASDQSGESGDINQEEDITAPDLDLSQTDMSELTSDAHFMINLVTEADAEVNINGVVAQATGGALNYDYNLVEGPNDITITVRDTAGNETTRTIQKTLDTTQPILVITNFQMQNNQTIIIEGQSEPGARVEANGYPLEVRADGTFYDEIAWTEGTIDVTIEATDLAGNQTLDRRSISGQIDSDAPQMVSAVITPSSVEPGTPVNILVELSDPSGIASSAQYTITGPAGTVIQGSLLLSGASSLEASSQVPLSAEAGNYTLSVNYADAVGNGGSSSQSGLLNVVVTPPSTITGLSATATASAVSLSWSTDPKASTYNIYRSLDGVNFSLIGTGMSASYMDASGVTSGVTYYYRVSGVDSRGNEGGQSAPVSVVPVDNSTPATPSGLSATPVDGTGNTTLSWTPPTSNTDGTSLTDLAGYELYLNGVLVNPFISSSQTSYSQGGLSTGSSYTFQLKAFDTASPPHKSGAASVSLP